MRFQFILLMLISFTSAWASEEFCCEVGKYDSSQTGFPNYECRTDKGHHSSTGAYISDETQVTIIPVNEAVESQLPSKVSDKKDLCLIGNYGVAKKTSGSSSAHSYWNHTEVIFYVYKMK